MAFTRQLDGQLFQQALGNMGSFLKEVYDNYICKGKALLTIRNNDVTVYYQGNQLCQYQENKGFTDPTIYSKFLPLWSVVKDHKYCTEGEWLSKTGIGTSYRFSDVFLEILGNIERLRDGEAYQVSHLYKFSPLCINTSDIVLLDIEAAMAESDKSEDGKVKNERIDVVLYHTIERQLIFVEVKRWADNRLQKNGKVETDILKQMTRYYNALHDPKKKQEIMDAYDNVINFYNSLPIQNGTKRKLDVIDREKELLLGLCIVEYTSDKQPKVTKLKKDISSKECVCDNNMKWTIPVVSIGDTKNTTEKTLNALYDTFNN